MKHENWSIRHETNLKERSGIKPPFTSAMRGHGYKQLFTMTAKDPLEGPDRVSWWIPQNKCNAEMT